MNINFFGRKAVQDISSSSLDFLKLSNELSQDSVEHVSEVLASTALFRPCDSILPYMAAPKARRIDLRPKEVQRISIINH